TSISLMTRDDMPDFLELTRPKQEIPFYVGDSARQILELLRQRGAMFFNDLQGLTGRLRSELDQALWELVSAGAISCDGFAGIRNLINPSRRKEKQRLLERYSGARGPLFLGGGGRWSLLRPPAPLEGKERPRGPLGEPSEIEALAHQYLRRW